MFDLHQKVAVVTGAGSGIGAAIAALFSRQGARVVGVDLNDSAEATVAAIRNGGGDAAARTCDVGAASAVARLFDEVHTTYGRVDILVNNAGITRVGTIEQTTPEDLDRLYAVNVRGVFLCSRAAVGIMPAVLRDVLERELASGAT
jgi:NAD(P)-dependent dehydrogenase (short-subunit alcohol dehydrogenase family)